MKDIYTDERLLVSGGPGNPENGAKVAFQLPQLGHMEKLTYNVSRR